MLSGLALLLAFQLAGELIVQAIGLPIPGPICGMALLLGWLAWRGAGVPEGLGKASDEILANMAILFVPAGVGVMAYWDLLSRDGLAIGAALVGSTLLTIAATALVVGRVSVWRSRMAKIE